MLLTWRSTQKSRDLNAALWLATSQTDPHYYCKVTQRLYTAADEENAKSSTFIYKISNLFSQTDCGQIVLASCSQNRFNLFIFRIS